MHKYYCLFFIATIASWVHAVPTLGDSDFVRVLSKDEKSEKKDLAPPVSQTSSTVTLIPQPTGQSSGPSATTEASSTTSIPISVSVSVTSAAPTSVITAFPSATGSQPSGPTININYQQFLSAIDAYSDTSAGGTPPAPSQDFYEAFIYITSGMSVVEAAMFLSNIIWETGGLQYMSELCNTTCGFGDWYGRGFIQLTYQSNYQSAADFLGESDIEESPDSVATLPFAATTAWWFWVANVRQKLTPQAISSFELGWSVLVINGGLECNGGSNVQAGQNRLAIFKGIIQAWNIPTGTNTPSLAGCQ